jgi:hypothetical protein
VLDHVEWPDLSPAFGREGKAVANEENIHAAGITFLLDMAHCRFLCREPILWRAWFVALDACQVRHPAPDQSNQVMLQLASSFGKRK